MNINWTVRLKNKTFWLTIIPALFLTAETVCKALGVSIDLKTEQELVLQVVNVVFAVAAATGVVIDHTTAGVSDSEQALTYTEPKQ